MSGRHHSRRIGGPPNQHTDISQANNSQQRNGRNNTAGTSRNRRQSGINKANERGVSLQRNHRPQRGNPPGRKIGPQSGSRALKNNSSNPPDGNNLAFVLRPNNSRHRIGRPRGKGRTPPVRDPNRPPPGFVFVPKGDVFITRKCTTLSTERGIPAEIVYVRALHLPPETPLPYFSISHLPSTPPSSIPLKAIPTNKQSPPPQDPTTHLRLGLYVHRPIHHAVLAVARATASARAAAVERKDASDLSKARAALAERYVAMPGADMDAILARAFAKGSGNVGRTTTLDPARRASLAVEAHVRHTYTEYDGLLREGVAREEARRRIVGRVRGVKAGWRADKERKGNQGSAGDRGIKGSEGNRGNKRSERNRGNKGSEGNKGNKVDEDTEMTGM
ncbi:MAG: hypothetical protein Q9165_006788 [Trypethelium subeluteriae]